MSLITQVLQLLLAELSQACVFCSRVHTGRSGPEPHVATTALTPEGHVLTGGLWSEPWIQSQRRVRVQVSMWTEDSPGHLPGG